MLCSFVDGKKNGFTYLWDEMEPVGFRENIRKSKRWRVYGME